VPWDKDSYLRQFQENHAAILHDGAEEWDASVFGCPGWDLATLVAHVGAVYTFWIKWIRDRPVSPDQSGVMQALMQERDDRLPGYLAWREAGFGADARPDGIIQFVREAGDELSQRLRSLDPSEPVWTFFAPNQTAGFVNRRIMHETTIHRWDVANARGNATGIARELAADGLDEYLNMAIQLEPPNEEGRPRGDGSPSYQFLPSDGAPEWHVQFGPRPPNVSRGRQVADIMVRGSSADLLLFVWGRMPASRMHVAGDVGLANRWHEYAGRF
jgi:uncharacterized protein (TIGR03083 family)